MPCHRPMLAQWMCRLFTTQTGWRAPSIGLAGDVFGEEQAVQTSHQRRTSSHLRSHGSGPIARYLVLTAEYRRAFGDVLRPLASGHRRHRRHHFWQKGV
jgi:hypothetical protein